MTNYKGQSEKFDDLKTGTPSVFHVKDTLSRLDSTFGGCDNFL